MLKVLEKIDAVIGKFTLAVSAMSIIGILGVMLIIVCDILKRLITNEALIGTYEIVERLLMCAVFASFAYTQYKKGHVRVTMLVTHFPQKLQFLLYALTCLASVILSGLLCYAVVGQVQYSYTAGTSTGVLFIPLYPFFIIECIAMAIYAITVLWDAVKGFLALGSKSAADFLTAGWG